MLDAEVKAPGTRGGAFLICYSFELAVWKFGLARLPARVGKKFGVMPVYPTEEGQKHPIFERFGDRFFAFEHRNWEAVDTDDRALRSLGGQILARESRIGRSDKGDAILALHLGPAIEAVQFHPEGDREGILAWVRKTEQANAIREAYGDETHDRMLRSLSRPERIERVYREMVPAWMLRTFNRLAPHRGWNPVAHAFPAHDTLRLVDDDRGAAK